ncbi:MAG TPA: hypothetical protein VIM10_15865 [Actinopolymorphaceae bacterium]
MRTLTGDQQPRGGDAEQDGEGFCQQRHGDFFSRTSANPRWSSGRDAPP